MPVQNYRIDRLTGMNRNAVDDSTPNPVEVVNLVPIRDQGWVSRGYEKTKNPNYQYPIPSATVQVIGYDHEGYSSFIITSGTSATIRVLDPEHQAGASASKQAAIVKELAVHLQGVGGYMTTLGPSVLNETETVAFVVKSRGGQYVTSKPGNIAPTVVQADDTGALPLGYYRGFVLTYLATRKLKLALLAREDELSARASGFKSRFTYTHNAGPLYGTELYLARNPASGSFTDLLQVKAVEYVRQADLGGSRTSFVLDRAQFGPTLNPGAYGFPVVPVLKDNSTTQVTNLAVHNGRVYFSPSNDPSSYAYKVFGFGQTPAEFSVTADEFGASIDLYSPFTVGWTERGYLNLFNPPKNYYTLAPKNSASITAFTSTEKGLLVFLDNECFMMTGDPAYVEAGRWEDFNFLPYLQVGCDAGTVPGQLGPDVFSVWKGEVFAVTGGQGQNVSRPVYDRLDPFVQVVGDAEQRAILCRTKTGKVYAYYPEFSHWTRVFADPVSLLLPTPNAVYALPLSGTGARFLERSELSPTLPLANCSATFVTTLGDKHRRKMIRSLRLPVSLGFSGTASIVFSVDGQASPNAVQAVRYADSLMFPFPLGWSGYQFTLTLRFTGMKPDDTIEAPIDIEYVDRGQKR